MSKSPGLIEKAFVILALTSFAGILYVLPMAGLLPKVVSTLIRYFVWVASSILVCIFWKNTIITVSRNILLYILVAIAFLSFLWSEFPQYSLFNGIDLLMMSLFGLYFATRFSLKEQVQLVACSLLIGAILSAIIALGFPAVGVHGADEDHPGAWKGVYWQKNVLGSTMVLSSLTFFALPKENSSLYRWIGFSFSLVLMLLSTSRTALVLSFLLILIMMFYKNFRWQGKLSLIFIDIGILILGCVALLVFSSWVELLTDLGRDPTLTGRTPIWGYMLDRLMERPWLGYGFRTFWAPESQYAVEAGQAVGYGSWLPPNGHNGLMDLVVDVGLIGLSLFLITYFTTFAQALRRAYATKNREELWPLAYLIFLAMNNVTESFLMRSGNMYWALFVTVVVTMSQKKQIQKIQNLKNKNFLHVAQTIKHR